MKQRTLRVHIKQTIKGSTLLPSPDTRDPGEGESRTTGPGAARLCGPPWRLGALAGRFLVKHCVPQD